MFIGRAEELNFLRSRYNRKEGQLIVLYGRRRVGKTETLREFCKDKPHVFYSCKECTDDEQLKSFSRRTLQKGMPIAEYVSSFANWEQAFNSILELPAGGGKKLLVIDEFPYMVHGNNEIPSILQNLWDEKLKNENIMIILCGSAMSFIEREILAEKNPLFGRATGILKMKAMDFYEAVQFFPGYSNTDKITAYSVLGGIPHYLKQFDESVALAENIKENILQRGSILYSEVEFLMRQELRETSIYNTILEAIALGNTKLNDIFQKTQIEKTKLSVYIKNLVELGIVQREFPVLDTTKGKANVQRGLYALSDNFFRFWYYFIFPNISEIDYGDVEGVYEHLIEPKLDLFSSKIFEDVCISYMRRENKNKKLPIYFTKIGRQWKADFEIDIIAHDAEKKNFLLGECKYRNNPFDTPDYDKAIRKFNTINGDNHYFFFSKTGFDHSLSGRQYDAKIHLIDLNTICKAHQ